MFLTFFLLFPLFCFCIFCLLPAHYIYKYKINAIDWEEKGYIVVKKIVFEYDPDFTCEFIDYDVLR